MSLLRLRIALWQLRDIDHLLTWKAGRCIIVGDAAHAMLLTQGQGASQSIEDAEALSTFFSTTTSKSTLPDITRALSNIFEARYRRSSLIQAYSRQQAKSVTETGGIKFTLNAAEFLDYNCKDEAAMKWLEEQRRSTSQAASSSQLRTAIDDE